MLLHIFPECKIIFFKYDFIIAGDLMEQHPENRFSHSPVFGQQYQGEVRLAVFRLQPAPSGKTAADHNGVGAVWILRPAAFLGFDPGPGGSRIGRFRGKGHQGPDAGMVEQMDDFRKFYFRKMFELNGLIHLFGSSVLLVAVYAEGNIISGRRLSSVFRREKRKKQVAFAPFRFYSTAETAEGAAENGT